MILESNREEERNRNKEGTRQKIKKDREQSKI
jgi:hypothetical protein